MPASPANSLKPTTSIRSEVNDTDEPMPTVTDVKDNCNTTTTKPIKLVKERLLGQDNSESNSPLKGQKQAEAAQQQKQQSSQPSQEESSDPDLAAAIAASLGMESDFSEVNNAAQAAALNNCASNINSINSSNINSNLSTSQAQIGPVGSSSAVFLPSPRNPMEYNHLEDQSCTPAELERSIFGRSYVRPSESKRGLVPNCNSGSENNNDDMDNSGNGSSFTDVMTSEERIEFAEHIHFAYDCYYQTILHDSGFALAWEPKWRPDPAELSEGDNHREESDSEDCCSESESEGNINDCDPPTYPPFVRCPPRLWVGSEIDTCTNNDGSDNSNDSTTAAVRCISFRGNAIPAGIPYLSKTEPHEDMKETNFLIKRYFSLGIKPNPKEIVEECVCNIVTGEDEMVKRTRGFNNEMPGLDSLIFDKSGLRQSETVPSTFGFGLVEELYEKVIGPLDGPDGGVNQDSDDENCAKTFFYAPAIAERPWNFMDVIEQEKRNTVLREKNLNESSSTMTSSFLKSSKNEKPFETLDYDEVNDSNSYPGQYPTPMGMNRLVYTRDKRGRQWVIAFREDGYLDCKRVLYGMEHPVVDKESTNSKELEKEESNKIKKATGNKNCTILLGPCHNNPGYGLATVSTKGRPDGILFSAGGEGKIAMWDLNAIEDEDLLLNLGNLDQCNMIGDLPCIKKENLDRVLLAVVEDLHQRSDSVNDLCVCFKGESKDELRQLKKKNRTYYVYGSSETVPLFEVKFKLKSSSSTESGSSKRLRKAVVSKSFTPVIDLVKDWAPFCLMNKLASEARNISPPEVLTCDVFEGKVVLGCRDGSVLVFKVPSKAGLNDSTSSSDDKDSDEEPSSSESSSSSKSESEHGPEFLQKHLLLSFPQIHSGEVQMVNWKRFRTGDPIFASAGGEDATILLFDLNIKESAEASEEGKSSPRKNLSSSNVKNRSPKSSKKDKLEEDLPPQLVFKHRGHREGILWFNFCPDIDWLICSTGLDNQLQLWQPLSFIRERENAEHHGMEPQGLEEMEVQRDLAECMGMNYAELLGEEGVKEALKINQSLLGTNMMNPHSEAALKQAGINSLLNLAEKSISKNSSTGSKSGSGSGSDNSKDSKHSSILSGNSGISRKEIAELVPKLMPDLLREVLGGAIGLGGDGGDLFGPNITDEDMVIPDDEASEEGGDDLYDDILDQALVQEALAASLVENDANGSIATTSSSSLKVNTSVSNLSSSSSCSSSSMSSSSTSATVVAAASDGKNTTKPTASLTLSAQAQQEARDALQEAIKPKVNTNNKDKDINSKDQKNSKAQEDNTVDSTEQTLKYIKEAGKLAYAAGLGKTINEHGEMVDASDGAECVVKAQKRSSTAEETDSNEVLLDVTTNRAKKRQKTGDVTKADADAKGEETKV